MKYFELKFAISSKGEISINSIILKYGESTRVGMKNSGIHK